MLAGKHILLGVTGGIAAYKTTFLVRLLIRQGAQVKVIMTSSAKDFVSPLTLSTLSQHPVYSDFVDEADGTLQWNNHVELAKWADLFLIAPLTSNTLAKMVSGACDNLLLAAYMSSSCKVFVAPAMDLDMYAHPATHENLSVLESRGVDVIPATSGFLASGLEGEGRMAEPESIVEQLIDRLQAEAPLYQKKVLINAGPTRESLDPVRFMSNHSTGTMGYELALRAYELGADVTLISGPVSPLALPEGINRIYINTAAEMYDQVMAHFSAVDIFIASAAVADYTFEETHPHKLKKGKEALSLNLIRTKDILAGLVPIKKNQVVVGFALESDNDPSKALSKMKAKGLDAIVYNTLSDSGAGFGPDTNKVTLYQKDGSHSDFPLQSKHQLAKALWSDFIAQWF